MEEREQTVGITGAVADVIVNAGDFSAVAVAGDDEDAVGFGLLDQLIEALLLEREIAPFFPGLIVGHKLNARADDAEIGRDFQLLFEPFPLNGAQDGGGGIAVGGVAAGGFGDVAVFVGSGI